MNDEKYLTIQEASEWVSKKFNRRISQSNISYLIQYGQVKKYQFNGAVKVSQNELCQYYSAQNKQENKLKKELGEGSNWVLSFSTLKESERTKHVHRLHPYKGKFIPQLVEYFLDDHTDQFKTERYFKPGDIILDPFCGSGTTLVQANELGIHAVGVDVSEFNTLICNVKIGEHDLINLNREILKITKALTQFVFENNWDRFESELSSELSRLNDKYFPTPDYRYRVRNGKIDEINYVKEKEREARIIFERLVSKYKITVIQHKSDNDFISKWYLDSVRKEIDYLISKLDEVKSPDTKDILQIILSRTIRSCRATTHADLATLIDPVYEPYYCKKHFKICKPLFSTLKWWKRYSSDTLHRLSKFKRLRTNTHQLCLTGDSRYINILELTEKNNLELSQEIKRKGINGIFSSPPYVGLINYHEQHAYAYDLFGFNRNDEKEIGPLFRGTGQEAKDSYVDGVSQVLRNSRKYLLPDFDIFLVANDKHKLYPLIAEKSGLTIVNEFHRPVLNRTEKDKSAYSEVIFHMKGK
ncbi:MAG: hypothetical protein KK926_09855 [Methanomethylovorans sp.]|nr:hypothetical protein [Methanomethylovorans sp.]